MDININEINGRLNRLQYQREQAQNESVLLAGRLTVAEDEIRQLREQLEAVTKERDALKPQPVVHASDA